MLEDLRIVDGDSQLIGHFPEGAGAEETQFQYLPVPFGQPGENRAHLWLAAIGNVRRVGRLRAIISSRTTTSYHRYGNGSPSSVARPGEAAPS